MNQNNNLNNQVNTNPVNNSNNVQVPVNQQMTVNTVATNSFSPAVSQVVSESDNTDNSENNSDVPTEKYGKFKSFVLIVFFILLGLFVFLLPEISNFLKSGSVGTSEVVINSGTLSCSTEKSNDDTTTTYEHDFKFTNKKLITSSLNVTTESDIKKVINEKHTQCQNISNISQNINGIDVTCTSSDNINTMIESYTYQTINNNGLTMFTEAGGTYPEYKYQENIYDIQSSMIKAGYDCKVTAN